MDREEGEKVYSPGERRGLERALARGEELRCPACGAPLARHGVAPHPGLPYVRRRVLLVCPSCRRSAAVDAARQNPP